VEKKRENGRMPEIYAFIDSTNLHLSIREQGWRLDYGRFRKYLFDKYRVTKALYFIGFLPTNRNLYASLRKSGYKLRFKPTSVNVEGEIKGNVDAELIFTAMATYAQYDKAIIVAGDGDYYCLIKYLKRRNKLLKIIIPDRNNYSWLLRRFSPDLVFMNGMRKKLEFRRTSKKSERHRLRTEPFG
jgi:uncharacterized LabA/DUF88 family protein